MTIKAIPEKSTKRGGKNQWIHKKKVTNPKRSFRFSLQGWPATAMMVGDGGRRQWKGGDGGRKQGWERRRKAKEWGRRRRRRNGEGMVMVGDGDCRRQC